MDNKIRVFVIADNHFGHEAIINHCHRPFKDVIEMNDTMYYNWQRVVRSEDLVLVLGDIGLHNRGLDWERIKSLKGNKVLVRGNHDKKSNHFYLTSGFVFVCNQFVWSKYVFSHTPLIQSDPRSLDKYIYNFHGHIHNKVLADVKSINVSVEQPYINYTPQLLSRLLELRSGKHWSKYAKKSSD
jgi:calcineurin-like phosphoesterase family protein